MKFWESFKPNPVKWISLIHVGLMWLFAGAAGLALQFSPPCFAQDLKALPMRQEYVGEHLRAKDPVHYYSESQLPSFAVTFRDGIMIDANGDPVTSYLNQPSLYVITPDGEIRVSRFSRHGLIHHSSLASGGPLRAAGQMWVVDGVIRAIDLESGHYRFPMTYLDWVLRTLAAQGVSVDRITIHPCSSGLRPIP